MGHDSTCAYCRRHVDRLTQEHLLPRSAGGTLVIRVCEPCNRARGKRGDYPPFCRYIRDHRDQWRAAVAATSDAVKTLAWLRDWGYDDWCAEVLRL